jgi:ABC-type tungstate transport system substrate-binding protein
VRIPVHPHLLVLRTTATVILSLLVAQAGWAAAFLGDSRRYFPVHRVFAVITVVAVIAGLIVYLVLRRTSGPVLLGLMITVAAMVIIQFGLGEAHVKALHIFFGVLTAMAGTALTSWTYRHPGPPSP